MSERNEFRSPLAFENFHIFIQGNTKNTFAKYVRCKCMKKIALLEQKCDLICKFVLRLRLTVIVGDLSKEVR